jgi:hypothetical protein
MNIFNKIYEIMNEYNNLLDKKNNQKFNYENNISEPDYENKYKNDDIFGMDDDFFKYIFKNINIELNNNIFNNTENQESNNNNLEYNNNKELNNINKNTLDNIKKSNNNDNIESNNNDNIELNNNDNIESNNNDNIELNNDNNIESNNNDNIESDEIINNYIKKIYKKIILKCHPDKNGDKLLFIKCKEYYENKLLIGILYIGYKIKYNLPELNQFIIKHILFEIRVIQEKIINLKIELKKYIH